MNCVDFFISYRWNTYMQEASHLYELLNAAGFTAWLDTHNPPPSFIGSPDNYKRNLANHLKNAIDSCRYVLFFETAGTLAMQIGGPSVRVISWQEQELFMVNENKLITLYHSMEPKFLSFGKSERRHEYQGLDDALLIIQTVVSKPNNAPWK